MNGQWIGEISGTNKGEIILNLDETDSAYEGVAYVLEAEPEFIGFAVFITTPSKDSAFTLTTTTIFPINPITHLVDTFENLQRNGLLPEKYDYPNSITATFCLEEDDLKISWKTNHGTHGDCIFHKRPDNDISTLEAEKLNWDDFKKYVSNLRGRGTSIFRGQNEPWRLQTGYHRTGRADLTRFRRDDIPRLHQKLSARTKHIFNLESPLEFGSFLNLLQHHGYPTPMLDWTYSPYVALFFAYRGMALKNDRDISSDRSVRVFEFDLTEWELDFHPILNLLSPFQHISKGEFLAIENERVIPQQALTLFTSVADIEHFIRKREIQKNKKYLKAIDIPLYERARVIKELSLMGLQAGALFPGLDGICEEQKERNFQY